MYFRAQLGWRHRHVFGALGLRPAIAQHTVDEDNLLRRLAATSHVIVELGVAEGGSAVALQLAAPADARLHLVDPYFRNRLGTSFARVIARRAVGRVPRGRITWVEKTSAAAADDWSGPIDLLLIDADHSYDRALEDWQRWSVHVRGGGVVVFHDARPFPGGWVTADAGSARVVDQVVRQDPGWNVCDEVDSMVAFRRTA